MMNETQNQRARVLGMHGFGLEVPDLDEAEKYYTAFGLVLRHKGECLAFACPGRDQDEVVIAKGAKKRLHHVAFSINPNQIERFKTALRDRNIRFREQPPRGGYSEGLWFLDPWGTWLNLVPRLPAPPRDVQRDFASNEFGEKKRISIAGFRRLDTSGLPRKLGHIVMFTPDWAKAEAYYTDVLGLEVTERAVGKVSFFNAPLGDSWDHHCFAILANPGRGIQHSSFEVASIDQVGFCDQRMRQHGYADGFGPGRQALGSNFFSYISDPWGSYTEIYSDLDQLDSNWQTVDWQELPKVWGPEWDPKFWTQNLEAE